MLESDSQAREYIERALQRWRATDGQNLTRHALFQITEGQHQDVRPEWIGTVLAHHYAHQSQTDERGLAAACWGDVPDLGKVLKVIVNPEGFVVTVHFDRREQRRMIRERGEGTW